jgi:hypothetical protein
VIASPLTNRTAAKQPAAAAKAPKAAPAQRASHGAAMFSSNAGHHSNGHSNGHEAKSDQLIAPRVGEGIPPGGADLF